AHDDRFDHTRSASRDHADRAIAAALVAESRCHGDVVAAVTIHVTGVEHTLAETRAGGRAARAPADFTGTRGEYDDAPALPVVFGRRHGDLPPAVAVEVGEDLDARVGDA